MNLWLYSLLLFIVSYVNGALIYYQNYEYMLPIKLLDYRGFFGNTKIQRFTIPEDCLLAIWRIQLNTADKCASRDAYFYLEYSGFPLITPFNQTFPSHYTLGRLTKHKIKYDSYNGGKHELFLNISSPLPGHYYTSAFIDYLNKDSIKPSDLFRSNCTTYLTTSINLWRINDTKVLQFNIIYQFLSHTQFKIFKFFSVPHYGTSVKIIVTHFSSNTKNSTINCLSTILLRQLAFPDLTNFDINDDYQKCFNQTSCYLTIEYPLLSSWYYLAIESSICNYSIEITYKECENCQNPIETFRFIGPSYFLSKYYFNYYTTNVNNNRSNTIILSNNKTNNSLTFIELLVDQSNSGGTLYMYFMNMFIRNKTSSINDYNDNKSSFIELHLYICLLYNTMNYKKCQNEYRLTSKATLNSDLNNLIMNIPYPMNGKWYIALWKECVYLPTNETIECPSTHIPSSMMQISTDQCGNDYCGDFGTCQISNQIYVFSACKCSSGYEGYGCTDERNALPRSTLILSVLFLTISNLLFLLPISIALYKRLYIEALIYFYNMFFSTFYHACDQEFYSFCIFNYDGLQLADFISSYTSFTITILSMSAFIRKWKVFTFFAGLLACLSINLYDRFSSFTFIIALCVSVSVTMATWVQVCVVKRKMYPDKNRIIKFYIPGIILAISGLVIYIFLQTRNNYYILHSIWHICMAISIVFFLPPRKLYSKGAYDIVLNHVNTSSSMSTTSAETNTTLVTDEANLNERLNVAINVE